MRLSRPRGQMGEKHLGPKQKPSTTHIMNRYKFGFRNRSAADQLHFCERLLVPIAALPPERRSEEYLAEAQGIALRQTCRVKGLQPGAKYWFRVRASNANGAGPWSNPVGVRVR